MPDDFGRRSPDFDPEGEYMTQDEKSDQQADEVERQWREEREDKTVNESIKINKLEIENVKRVKAVKLEPSENGLTIVGGNNNQGKTSVLDTIAWGLGGGKFKPSEPHREGSTTDPYLKIVLSNGLVVERKGKNSSLKVTDPEGKKSGQTLLDEFVDELALNLPKFMQASNKEKADALLRIIGVGEQLTKLELQEKEKYNERYSIGRIADQKEKFAKEMPYYPDVPKDPVSATDLIKQQQEILAKNGENQRKRDRKAEIDRKVNILNAEMDDLEKRIAEKRVELDQARQDQIIASKTAEGLIDESTVELESNIANIEEINVKVRANLDKDKAEEDALNFKNQYDELTKTIENIRKQKMDLLNGAEMPLVGLSVEDGELTYNGFKWDNMSGSQQLQVATAIVQKLNPKCGFVLLDKLEQMDIDTLNEFGQWLESQGLQAIATRVSTGEECSIIIDDGYATTVAETMAPAPAQTKPKWTAGTF